MALEQTAVEWIYGALVIGGYLLAASVVVSLLWSPFLAAGRVRSLFSTLPPSRSWLVTYPLFSIGGTVAYLLVVSVVLAVTAGGSTATIATALVNLILLLSAAIIVGLPTVAGFALPKHGIDWDPTGYGIDTWALLFVGGIWYAMIFAVPSLFATFLFALPS